MLVDLAWLIILGYGLLVDLAWVSYISVLTLEKRSGFIFFFVSLISCLVIEKSEENARKMMAWDFQKMARGRERGTITGERS